MAGTEEKYKGKLSVGTYAFKQISDIVISFGSMFAGGYIGNLLGKKFAPKATWGKDYVAMITDKEIHAGGTLIGGLLGSIISGIFQGYSRWRKHEAERLAVSEINEDVANMKIHYRTDPQLVKENDRLREMLAEEEKKTAALAEKRPTPAEKIAAEGAKSPLDPREAQGVVSL